MAQTIEGLIRGETRRQTEERNRQRTGGGMTLAQIRRQYPEYDDMTDEDLARGLHRKHYSDMPFADFAQRIRLGEPSRPNQRVSTDQPRNLYDEVSGFASQVRASIPGSDEIQGAIRGFGGAVEGFVNPSSGGVSVLDTTKDGISLQERLQGARGGYQREYGTEVERERDQRDDFMARRPVTSMAAQLPAGTIAGNVALRAAGTGGNLAVRAVKAAAAGGAVGGVYGATSEGDLAQRGQNALTGAGTGAAFGAAFPIAGRMYGQRLNALGTPAAVAVNTALGGAGGYYLADQMGLTDEEKQQWATIGAGVGAGTTAAAPLVRAAAPKFNALLADRSGSVPRPPGPKPSGGSTVRDEVDQSLLRMAQRRRLTPAEAERIAQEAEATGRNPLAAQVLGEPGLQRLQTNATLPGQSAQRTAETIAARRSGAAARASEDVDAAFGPQTRQSAQQGIDQAYERMSPQYNDLLSRTQIAPDKAAPINQALSRIPQSEMKDVTAAASRIAHYDGLTFEQLPPAQQLHYIKMGLDQRIKAMGREGLAGTERQRLVVATKNLRTAMEDAIPGYRGLNGQWMDNVQAEEALTWADDFFAGGKNAMRPEEIAAEFQAMSPAQQEAAKISIRTRMLSTIEDRVRTGVRKTNVVDPFLSQGFENRIRAVLGDEAVPLMRKFRAEDRDFSELGSAIPRSNSKTAAVFADMMDQMAQGAPTRGNILANGADFLWRKATNPLLESRRNKETERLLKELTPAQIRALRKAITDNIARRDRLTRDAVTNAAAGATFTDQ